MPFAPFEQSSPDGTNVGGRMGEAANSAANMGVGIAAAKAGVNHYQQGAGVAEAAGIGAYAFVRIMVWLMALVLWSVIILLNSINGGLAANHSGVSGQVADSLTVMGLAFLIAPFTLGVNWCRNSDYCLFRRGPVYRFFAPISRMVEVVPTWALYVPLGILAVL